MMRHTEGTRLLIRLGGDHESSEEQAMIDRKGMRFVMANKEAKGKAVALSSLPYYSPTLLR